MYEGSVRHQRSSGLTPRLLAAALLVGAVTFLAPAPAAHAACNTVIDQVATVERADSVFVGRVIHVADSSRLATIEVIEIWKGPDLAPQVIVNGSFSGNPQIGANDRTFMQGSTYLVVPFGNRSPFFDEACSGTALYSPTGGLIPAKFHDAVGTTTARLMNQPAAAPTSDDTGGGVDWLFIAGGAVVVGALFALTIGRRGKSSPSQPRRKAASAPPSFSGNGSPASSNGGSASGNGSGSFDAVARRRKNPRKAKKRVKSAQSAAPKRFSKSGIDNLEAMRKKTRRVKKKKRKTRA